MVAQNATGGGGASPVGRAGLTIIRPGVWVPDELQRRIRDYDPKSNLGRLIKRAAALLPLDQAAELIDAIARTVIVETSLELTVIRANGRREGLGIVSRKVVTTTGVGFLVDAFQNLTELENMKFHGIGTGTNAEAVGDTALQTELTTQYNPDNTRATGTTTENAANIYRTVGTNAVDAAAAITEHGVLSQAAVGGGVLFDRSVFSVVNLASGDSLQSTYDATFSAGG